MSYPKYAARHLLVHGYRAEAAKALFVYGMNVLTANGFMKVLRLVGLRHWILSGLPLTATQIRHGQEIAQRHGLRKATP